MQLWSSLERQDTAPNAQDSRRLIGGSSSQLRRTHFGRRIPTRRGVCSVRRLGLGANGADDGLLIIRKGSKIR